MPTAVAATTVSRAKAASQAKAASPAKAATAVRAASLANPAKAATAAKRARKATEETMVFHLCATVTTKRISAVFTRELYMEHNCEH